MMKFLLIISISLFSCTYLGAQSAFKAVRLFAPNVRSEKQGQTEPSIAIDPRNPSIMAAGCIMDNYYYSTNGGLNWRAKTMNSTYGVWGDPVLMFDHRGRIYYFHLADYKKTVWIDRIVCQSADSVNGTFSNGTFPQPNGIKAQDKHWSAVDPISNTLYLTWTQFDNYGSKDPKDSSVILFSKSTDDGDSWSLPKRISHFAGDCIDDDNTVEGAVPAIGPNGEIYVAWAGPKGIVFQRSIDNGETWLPVEKLIGDQIGGWSYNVSGFYRSNGMPILTCDISAGPNRGTLYLNWSDERSGNGDFNVWLASSKDGGETWSEPIKVNQDVTNRPQFMTWMTVDQSTGNLYFVYYDRRNHADDRTDVYLSASFDGGNTFHDFKLTEKPFTPDKGFFCGDYLNIAAVSGVIRPIWPFIDHDKATLWVSIVSEEELLRLIAK